MNGEVLNKLALIKQDMGYLSELLERTDMLVGDCGRTLTELEQKGADLCGDDLSATVNHLDIYGAYLADIIFTTLGRIDSTVNELIKQEQEHGKKAK